MIRHFPPVVLANERDDMRDHFQGGVPVVAVFAAASENRVDNPGFPRSTARVESLAPSYRWAPPHAASGPRHYPSPWCPSPGQLRWASRICSRHRNSCFNRERNRQMRYQEKAPKNLLTAWEESILCRSCLTAGGVTGICFQGIKVNQVTAGAIHQEAKHRLEDLRHRLALGAFPQGAKQTFQDRENGYIAQIPRKKAQAASAVKVSEVASTLSITLLFSFPPAIVTSAITSHP